MIDRLPISRRRLFASSLVAAGGLVFASARPWRAVVAVIPPSDADRLVSLFTRPQSARAVGTAYLEVVPEEASVGLLVQRVAEGLRGGRPGLRAASSDQLRRILGDRIREDFEAEHVVSVRGWLLSETEARLYAIAALA